ncbi:MAG: YabP/YqfC family sporulation protein [Lachnospiraceae bacterium]
MKKYKKQQTVTEDTIRQKLLSQGGVGEVLYKKTLVTLIGQEELWIENYKSILEYEKEVVIIATNAGNIKVEGRNLMVSHYIKEQMMIKGFITNISYS